MRPIFTTLQDAFILAVSANFFSSFGAQSGADLFLGVRFARRATSTVPPVGTVPIAGGRTQSGRPATCSRTLVYSSDSATLIVTGLLLATGYAPQHWSSHGLRLRFTRPIYSRMTAMLMKDGLLASYGCHPFNNAPSSSPPSVQGKFGTGMKCRWSPHAGLSIGYGADGSRP